MGRKQGQLQPSPVRQKKPVPTLKKKRRIYSADTHLTVLVSKDFPLLFIIVIVTT